MFDFDIGKLMIVGIVALAVIPPKDLPRVMRTVGQAMGKMRRMAAEFQGQFMDAMREADLDSVRKELETLNEKAKIEADLDAVRRELDALNEQAKLMPAVDPVVAESDEPAKIVEPGDVATPEIALDAPAAAAPDETATTAGPDLPAEGPPVKPSAAA
jgi:sec-independent protein translocase protein TatB